MKTSVGRNAQGEIRHLANFPKINPNPIVEIGSSGEIYYLNPAAKKLFPDLESTRNKHPYLKGLSSLFKKVKSNKSKKITREIKVGNLWFQQTLHYVNDIKRIRIYGFDISNRKKFEVKLGESEERLNKTQEIAHLGTWGHDFISNKTYWSNETYRIYGYKPRQVVPSHIAFSKIVYPDDQKQVTDIYFDSLKSGKNGYTNIFRILKKSTGELRFIYEKCEHIRNSSGKIVNSIGMVQDITERKRAEQLLKESEEKFRAVAETAKDAIVSINSFGKIIYLNREAEKIFGYSFHEILNKPVAILMPERFRENHQNGFSRFLATGKPHIIGKTIEMAGKRKDGSEFPLEISLASWEVNKEVFFTAIIRDITERKILEQRKDDFITIAGHELRTPIATIKIINQMLHETVTNNPKTKKYLKKTDNQLAILTNLVNDLLNVQKIQTGKLELRKKQFNLQSLTKEVAEDLQKTTKEHKILVKGKIHAKINADEERIRQVLVNLFSNAIKFSPKGDRIMVNLKKNREKVLVSVTDYGIGIPKEHQNRIFGRFYRVYGSGEKMYPGLGMGLYISYEIIKLHRGDMWFKSTQKKGSTFSFSIPL